MDKLSKENILPKSVLDKMPINELVDYVDGIRLTDLEGYGGQNLYDHIPEYVRIRIRKECYYLENSEHHINTWNTYSLYTHLTMGNEAIMLTNIASTKGSTFSIRRVNYERKISIYHEVKFV